MKRCCLRLAKKVALTPLFGVGSSIAQRTPEQERARQKFETLSIGAAFPAIAAQWLPNYGGRPSLATPNNLTCLSPKKHSWQCQSCKGQFSKTIARHVDDHGQCPLCDAIPAALPSSKRAAAAPSAASLVPPRKSNYEHAYDASPSLKGLSIDPMLAREWLDVLGKNDFSDETLLASPKLDGMRCLVAFSKERNDLLYISRKGTLFESCDSLTKHLMPLFKADPNLMLDGEVYHPSMLFEELASTVRTTRRHRTPEAESRQQDLQYHAFDVMYSKHIKDPKKVFFPARYDLLKKMIPVESKKSNSMPRSSSAAFNPVMFVPASPMRQRAASVFLDKAVAGGYEGIMIRRQHFPYGFGKRTNALMKYKTFETEEFVVEAVEEGIGRCAGQAGSFVCHTKGGFRFNATPRSKGAVRQELWERRSEIVGQAVTVQFQGKSPDGVPRFPVALCVRGAPDGSNWF
jgi:DNA ligase 1